MTPAAKTKAVATTSALSPSELTTLLRGGGYASPVSTQSARIKLDGAIFKTTDTDEMYVYNPKHPETPAFTARIMKPVEDYMAIFIDEGIAREYGRLDLANTFSKSYFTDDPDRKTWPSDEVYEDLLRSNLSDQYGKPLKGSWKGDLQLQIIPEDGNLKGDETVYTLTLSTTSLIEFRGSSREPEAGTVSEFNFMQKLAQFAQENAGEEDVKKAVMNALVSYSLGGVAAEVRTARAENKEKTQSWTVVVFDPIHIEPMDENDTVLIGDGESE